MTLALSGNEVELGWCKEIGSSKETTNGYILVVAIFVADFVLTIAAN